MPEGDTSRLPRVVVVGGGIAGLTAAYMLSKRGLSVEVMEREAAPGGRMRSERHGDFIVERGAQFIASSYRNMHALAAELGIADLISPLRKAGNAVLKNGRFVTSEYEGLKAIRRSRDLSWPSKLRLLKIIVPLWQHRRLLDFYHPERAAPLDSESAASSAARYWTIWWSRRSPPPSRCFRSGSPRPSSCPLLPPCSAASASKPSATATAP